MTPAEPITLFDAMQAVQATAMRESDLYKTLVACGHRRRSPRDERNIQCLMKAAEELEKLVYDRGRGGR